MSFKEMAIFLLSVLISLKTQGQLPVRQDFILNTGWRTMANDSNRDAFIGFEKSDFDDTDWLRVNLPHNWDRYEGYRRMKHGNRHGYAWYRKVFDVDSKFAGKMIFLRFEGVGSYATVWINGKQAGYHAGGRTSFTVDITDYVQFGEVNLLAVRADHPANIRDLPWVCGGCSEERGFSEGSQPLGIFRPVHLMVTDKIHIEPFGVHVWNDTSVNVKSAMVNVSVEIRNDGDDPGKILIQNRLIDKQGIMVADNTLEAQITGGQVRIICFNPLCIADPNLWSLENPYLYKLETELIKDGTILDSVITSFGVRRISWPGSKNSDTSRFLLNGKSVFINGTAEYEHNMGQSHAFSDKQIRTRVMQVKAAGFNAFRDAHQPHNLRYGMYWDSLGILWWPQFAAHIWFDNNEFRENFKMLLRDWVKERRNSPSVILWGLENESTLPEDFAGECAGIIRELDPTASVQRLITTCNGGTGTDWNVVQNWSGTYRGDPCAYADEIQQQLLNGEYGAWRSIDLHTEGPFIQDGILSEDRMTRLMETKVRLAESVRDRCCGQFQWLLASHENPGRVQNGEGLRDIDRVGPVNYKGLFTLWGEPLDVFYMYRSNYAPKETEPMVYIVSHTWPNRWITAGIKIGVTVYSNCDEVELFNDIGSRSLGRKTRKGIGTHFQWDSIGVQYNVLYAVGYVNGKAVAEDCVVLNHLPVAHGLELLKNETTGIIAPRKGFKYLYRVNCGGPEYVDSYDNLWSPDLHQTSDAAWGSKSWTDEFDGLPAFYGSQRRTFDLIKGTADWKLFQSFRYGRDRLKFAFPVPEGEYLVELYFTEPWYGTGGGMNCRGWRVFDVAVNEQSVINDLDIWKEAGHDKALKKTIVVNTEGDRLVISFPEVLSGQAIISAIAVASEDTDISPAPESKHLIENLRIYDSSVAKDFERQTWLDIGDRQFTDTSLSVSSLPSYLYGAEWIRAPGTIATRSDTTATFNVRTEADVFIAIRGEVTQGISWLEGFMPAGTSFKNDADRDTELQLFSRRFAAGSEIVLGRTGDHIAEKMYTVIACPVYRMDQPADQRPVKHYQAESAVLSGAVNRIDSINEIQYVEFQNDTNGFIEWNITAGLAGKYSFGIRYMNPAMKAIPMELTLLTSDGKILQEQIIEFQESDNRWQTVAADTGSEINAGTCIVRLSVSGRKGIRVDEMTVQ